MQFTYLCTPVLAVFDTFSAQKTGTERVCIHPFCFLRNVTEWWNVAWPWRRQFTGVLFANPSAPFFVSVGWIISSQGRTLWKKLLRQLRGLRGQKGCSKDCALIGANLPRKFVFGDFLGNFFWHFSGFPTYKLSFKEFFFQSLRLDVLSRLHMFFFEIRDPPPAKRSTFLFWLRGRT